MRPILDAFWRAGAYCLHPRVIALSLLPLVIMALLALGLNYFFWEQAVGGINAWLLSSDWLTRGIGWLEGMGLGGLKAAIAPLIVIVAITPILVVVSLLFVAFMMTPAMVKLVALRRFGTLERKQGAGIVSSVLWSLAVTAAALLALVLTIPLWFIPPLVLIVPPLIWGWLTYRVMAFDTLADHASSAERKEIMRRHRAQLLAIGLVSGYMGAAPALLWGVAGIAFFVFAPFLILVAIWIYTLVFAFSSLWFAHYCLAALEQLRSQGLEPNESSAGMKSAQSAPDLIVDAASKPVAEPPDRAP